MEFGATPVVVDFDGAEVRSIRRLTDNVTLRGVRLEPELVTSIFDNEMEDRLPVSLKTVPKPVVDAIIATEDKNFYHHEGISIRGTLGALITDLRQRAWTHGGSTLTQQLVKNLYLNPERSWRRKGVEALMAVLLEAALHQGRDPRELPQRDLPRPERRGADHRRRAGLTALLRKTRHVSDAAGSGHAGGHDPLAERALAAEVSDRAKTRRDTVLQLMLEQGKITEADYKAAVASPLSSRGFRRTSRSAPFFVDLVMRQLRETYPETQLKTEGLRIFTTLDTIMQRSAEQALDSGVANLTKQYKNIKNSPTPLEGVILTIQPGTGYVKALVGGRNYSKTQFNRAIQAKRQPGSLFKPFVYVTAMDPARGQQAYTPATVLEDSPIAVQAGKAVWRPQNYDLRFHGHVTVRDALAHSYNIPAVRAAINAGVPNVIKTAASIGVESRLEPYPSISLGSFEVTPLEIAYAYSVFANLGVKAEPVSILAVATRDGKLLESREVKMKRVAPASVCYVMNDMLKDVFIYGTAGKAHQLLARLPNRSGLKLHA